MLEDQFGGLPGFRVYIVNVSVVEEAVAVHDRVCGLPFPVRP